MKAIYIIGMVRGQALANFKPWCATRASAMAARAANACRQYIKAISALASNVPRHHPAEYEIKWLVTGLKNMTY